jgi:hypothetical protein
MQNAAFACATLRRAARPKAYHLLSPGDLCHSLKRQYFYALERYLLLRVVAIVRRL